MIDQGSLRPKYNTYEGPRLNNKISSLNCIFVVFFHPEYMQRKHNFIVFFLELRPRGNLAFFIYLKGRSEVFF